jgi:hypothetical protein
MAAGKNTHLEHIEDEIINKGTVGAQQAISILREMGKMLSGDTGAGVSVTTKWDGAPAVVCGIDPADGKFFVGTKSVFNKNDPKICKSVEDVNKLYSGALAQKLIASYNLLKECGIKGVLQGDLMFTDDKKTETIQGERYTTFRPNTITYAAKVGSKMEREISAAQLGIVFHTKYNGDSLPTMTSSFNVKDSDFKASNGVWIQKAEFKNIGNAASFTSGELQKYNAAVNKAEGSAKQTKGVLDFIQSGKRTLQIDTEFKKFFNNYVKAGQSIPSVEKAYTDFSKHLEKEYKKQIDKLKTQKSQDRKMAELLEHLDNYQKMQNQFKMLIATYMNLAVAKNILVDKMKKISRLNLFVATSSGDYEVTTPEGFVAISGKSAVKLIDRLEFSRLNFTVPKNWG